MPLTRLTFASLICLVLNACSSLPTPPQLAEKTPEVWHAPLPHNGQLTELRQWWMRFEDPLLVELIEAAQEASPSIASAKTSLAKAQANLTNVNANFLPTLEAQAGVQRGTYEVSPSIQDALANQGQIGLKTSWELDVFGGNRQQSMAANQRYEGAVAAWHDARISVAADVANLYMSQLTCQQIYDQSQLNLSSQTITTTTTEKGFSAGLIESSDISLLKAGLADLQSRHIQQRAQCQQILKALVVLTAIPEPELITKLTNSSKKPILEQQVAIASIPAQVIIQRPDVFALEKELWAARADIGYAQAQRYPRVFLSGVINRNRVDVFNTENYLTTWTVGPLGISLPIFEGGRIGAQIKVTETRYNELLKSYEAKVRQAIREVEEALIMLDTAERSEQLALDALKKTSYARLGIEKQYQAGLVSTLDLEAARRREYSTRMNYAQAQQNHFNALVTLYRAVGGGWDRTQLDITDAS